MISENNPKTVTTGLGQGIHYEDDSKTVLLSGIDKYDFINIICSTIVTVAIVHLISLITDSEAAIIIAGSTFTVGQALYFLKNSGEIIVDEEEEKDVGPATKAILTRGTSLIKKI